MNFTVAAVDLDKTNTTMGDKSSLKSRILAKIMKYSLQDVIAIQHIRLHIKEVTDILPKLGLIVKTIMQTYIIFLNEAYQGKEF